MENTPTGLEAEKALPRNVDEFLYVCAWIQGGDVQRSLYRARENCNIERKGKINLRMERLRATCLLVHLA